MASSSGHYLTKVAASHQELLHNVISHLNYSDQSASIVNQLAHLTLQAASSNSRLAAQTLSEFLIRLETNNPKLAFVDPSQADSTLSPSQLAAVANELDQVFSSRDLPNIAESNFGTIRFIDYLRANIIWLVRQSIDLNISPTRPGLAEAIRALMTVLTQRFPGATIEIRVPPFAAAQVCFAAQGSHHRRGTPPNVVETNPAIFFELATGRLGFEQAISAGSLNCSGVHAMQLSKMLPVIRL